MDYVISAASDVGRVKETNQDSYNARILRVGQDKLAFAVLCDGMGGLSQGEVASAAVVRAFAGWTQTELPTLYRAGLSAEAVCAQWTGLAKECDERIKRYGASAGIHIGTTVTVLLLAGERYYILNVGDTRAYELSESARQLTWDHTLVAREVEQGSITEMEARTDPRRSVLLQCIGASGQTCPDFFSGEAKPDAIYLLCSDGFRHEVSGEEILHRLSPAVMSRAEDMKAGLNDLIALNKERQERDNITAIAIRTFNREQ